MMILYKLLLFQVIAYTLCSADNSIEDSQGSAESENYNERGQESQEVLPNPPKNGIGYTKPLVIEPKNCPLCKTVNWDELNEENAKNLTKALSNLSVYLNNTAQQLLQELQMDNLQSAMRRVSQLYAYIKGDAQQVDQQDEDVDKVQNEDLRKIQKQVYPKWNVDSVNEQQEGTLNATAKALHKIYKHLKDSYQRNFKPLFKKVMSKLHSFFKQKKQSIYRINPALKEFVSELIANVTDNRRKNLRSTKEQQKEIVDEDENEENSDNFDEEEKENSNASQNPLLAQLRKALSKLYNKKVNTQKKKKYNSNANLYLTDSDSDNLYEEEQKNQRLAKLKKALSRLYPINVSAEQKKKYNFNTVLREFVSELIANIADNRRQKSLKEQQKDVFRKILTETLSDLYPRPPTDDDDGWDPTDDEYDFDSYPHRKNQLQANLKKSLRRIYPIIYRQRSFTKKAKDFLKKVVVHLQETLSSLFAINIHALQKKKYKILKDLSEPIDTYPRLPTDDDYNWDNPNKPTDDDYDFDSYPNWSILDEAQERYFNGRKNQLQAKLKKSLYRLNSIKVNARLKNTALREVVSELIANIAANRRQQSLKKQQEDFFRKVLSESLSDLYSDPPDEDDYSWDYSDDLNLTDEDEDEDEDEYDDQETSDNLFEEAQENQQLTTLQRFLSRLYPNTANVQPKKKYNFNIVLREVLSDLYQNASDEDEDEDEENSDNSDEEGKDDFNTVRKQLLDELYAYIKANHQQHFDSLSREQKQNLKAVLEGVSELYVHLKYKDQQNFGTDLGLEQNSENVTEFVKHGVASLYAYLQRKYQENVDSLDEEQKEHSRALLNGVSEINALFNEGAQYAPQEESTSAGATTENRWIKIFSGGSNLTDVSSLLSQRLIILNPVINPVYVYANMGSDGERPEKIVLPETTTESENLASQTRAETENETSQSEQADGSATHTRGVTSDAALTEEQAVANSIVSQINEVRANSGSGSPNLWAIVNNQDSTAKTIFETGLVNVVNSGQTDEQASEAVRQANFDRGKLNSQVSISTNSAKPFPTYVDDSLPEYIRRQLTILGYDRRASGVNRNPKKRLLGSSNQHSIMYPEAVVDDSSVSPENKTSNASNRK